MLGPRRTSTERRRSHQEQTMLHTSSLKWRLLHYILFLVYLEWTWLSIRTQGMPWKVSPSSFGTLWLCHWWLVSEAHALRAQKVWKEPCPGAIKTSSYIGGSPSCISKNSGVLYRSRGTSSHIVVAVKAPHPWCFEPDPNIQFSSQLGLVAHMSLVVSSSVIFIVLVTQESSYQDCFLCSILRSLVPFAL